jgi:hypothetical protein
VVLGFGSKAPFFQRKIHPLVKNNVRRVFSKHDDPAPQKTASRGSWVPDSTGKCNTAAFGKKLSGGFETQTLHRCGVNLAYHFIYAFLCCQPPAKSPLFHH